VRLVWPFNLERSATREAEIGISHKIINLPNGQMFIIFLTLKITKFSTVTTGKPKMLESLELFHNRLA